MPEQTVNSAVYSIQWQVFITEMTGIYRVVQNESSIYIEISKVDSPSDFLTNKKV